MYHIARQQFEHAVADFNVALLLSPRDVYASTWLQTAINYRDASRQEVGAGAIDLASSDEFEGADDARADSTEDAGGEEGGVLELPGTSSAGIGRTKPRAPVAKTTEQEQFEREQAAFHQQDETRRREEAAARLGVTGGVKSQLDLLVEQRRREEEERQKQAKEKEKKAQQRRARGVYDPEEAQARWQRVKLIAAASVLSVLGIYYGWDLIPAANPYSELTAEKFSQAYADPKSGDNKFAKRPIILVGKLSVEGKKGGPRVAGPPPRVFFAAGPVKIECEFADLDDVMTIAEGKTYKISGTVQPHAASGVKLKDARIVSVVA